MRITYLGTACVFLEYAGLRLITDPVFDEPGGTYSMAPSWIPDAWFSSTRDYPSPATVAQLPPIDVVLLSHDHHSDNLDVAGRALVLGDTVGTVVTNPAAAKRLSAARDAVVGLATNESTTVGSVTITATPARHGPRFTPQASQVTGFLLEADDEPSVWISGDTVLTPALREWATEHRGIDVAVIHCGAVRFKKAPLLGRALFTFDPAQVVEVAKLLDPRVVIPIHRSGWTHFQPEEPLRAAFADSGLGPRVRWLRLGEAL